MLTIDPPPHTEGAEEAAHVAIVDGDSETREIILAWLAAAGYRTVSYASSEEVLEDGSGKPAVVCLDLSTSDERAVDVLRRLHAIDPNLPVIVVTSSKDAESAVDAMRAGAYEHLIKPIDRQRLGQALRRAMERRLLGRRVETLQHELDRRLRQPIPSMFPSEDRPVPKLDDLERKAIARALKASGGNVGKAAKLLGIGRATLYRRLAAGGIPFQEAAQPFLPR